MSGVGPKGLSQSTLELLADPKKLEKTLASLKEAQRQAQEVIDLAGPASEIITLRADALAEAERQREVTEEAENEAGEKVADAEAEANQVVVAAKKKATGLVESAHEAKKEVEREAAEVIAAAERKKAEVDAQQQSVTDAGYDLDRRANELSARESELDERDEELKSFNGSLLQEKAKLAELREYLTNALE